MKDNIFISPLYDSTFKYLWKKETSRKFFIDLIKLITTIDLSKYSLYDPELNSGNKAKDYRLDILFVKDKISKEVFNIEMYKDYPKYGSEKSRAYIFRLLGYSYKEGEEYTKRVGIQLNFINDYCPYDRNIRITNYMLRDMENDIELDDIKIYDVYLPICKGICYNSDDEDEVSSMLAFLGANSFEEMKKIANGNKEMLAVEKDLEDLIMEDKFMGVYNNEIEQKKIANTERYYGKLEGIEEGSYNKAIETAKKMKEDNVSIEEIMKYTSLSKEEIEKL